jgi:glutamate-5-semialdehyde dehydrogenase
MKGSPGVGSGPVVVFSGSDGGALALTERARGAARRMATALRADKDRALLILADALMSEAARVEILRANEADVREAKERGLDAAMVDRLALDDKRLAGVADAVREIAALEDPVGTVIGMTRRPNGILVGRVRVPLGVLLMIYESRPNVTVDAAALAIKSGNAVLLRGGKEAARSNAALGAVVRKALASANLPEDTVVIVPAGDREELKKLIGLNGKIDLAIPRGGEGLIRFVAENARVPVVQHYHGVCHLYVDAGADLDMAERLVEDGKLSRVSACNALECLLVHRAEAPALLPRLERLVAEKGLEIRADEQALTLVRGAKRAGDDDWGSEFLAKVLAVRVVSSFDEALDHIARYGSNHTEVICTRSWERGQRFLREVDASCVLVNASSRFNDGGELGLGAEMGISTSKIHAYGPMGLEHLTTLKWIAQGEGQTRHGL